MDDVLLLISKEILKDDLLVQQDKETKRQIFCQVRSVSRAEFFSGGQNGIAPEYIFDVFPADYAQEPEVEFHGKRYAVYRTFLRTADELELYVQKKGGVQ